MKTKHVLILVLALVVVSFFAGRISTLKPRNAQYDEITELTEVMTVYQREINGREQTIYEKNQIIASKKEAIEAGILERDRLKALNLKSVRQITKINAEFSAYKDSIDLEEDSVYFVDVVDVDTGETENYVELPFSWEHEDEFLFFSTGIRLNKKAWFDLSAELPITVTLGGRDGKQVAAVSTPNPYITVTDFNVIRLKEEKWYYKPWVPAAGGAIGGLGLGWLMWGR